MGLRDLFSSVLHIGDLTSAEIQCLEIAQELWYTKLAQHIVAERYGALLSKCEFKTYIKNREVKKDNWYKFNHEPNPNQTGCEFVKQLAHKLIYDMEALIIQTDNGNFYVADSFTKGQYQIGETTFTDVIVDLYQDGVVSPYQLTGTFKGDKAIYIKYSNKGALSLLGKMNGLYSSLINNVKQSGSNKLKYLLNIDATALNGVDVDIDSEIKRIVNKDFETLVSDNNTIMPVLNGFDLKPLNQANNNSQNATVASSNIDKMYESIMKNVAQAYNMPVSFMTGTYEENDMDDFLTFGIDPLADLISEAINRKYYGKKSILEGTYLYLDTKKIKHFDILTVSEAINKLISSGVYTINEIRTILEEQPIDDEIGDLHWITRNYAVVGDYVQEQSNYMGGNDEQNRV